jgi:hypothetical protein
VAAADPLGASGQALFTLTVSEPTALPPTEEPALTIHLYLPEVHR